MIYTSAIYANAEHTMVTGTDADGNTETVPSDYVIFRCPDDGPVGFVNNGGTIGPYVEPELVVTPPVPFIWGIGNFTISDYAIGGIELSVGFSAALYLDTGLYYLFFTETLPNTTYLAKAYDASALVRVSEKGQDYIAITATDTGGNAVDPSEISVEIIRVS